MSIDSKAAAMAAAAFAALVTTPLLAAGAEPAAKPEFTNEKCFGIAAAAKNDCQTATHSCAGESKQARDRGSWIYVPAGTCEKIEGGSLKSG